MFDTTSFSRTLIFSDIISRIIFYIINWNILEWLCFLFRETGSIEQHADALVALLESCLNHNLKPSPKDEDPPHAKISSDIISCIFLVCVIFFIHLSNCRNYMIIKRIIKSHLYLCLPLEDEVELLCAHPGFNLNVRVTML